MRVLLKSHDWTQFHVQFHTHPSIKTGSVSIFVFISFSTSHPIPSFPPLRPPHPSQLPGPRVPEFWTRFDLAMIDCRRVHSSFSGHLSPPRSQESEGKRRMKWSRRRRDGFIDSRLRLGSMHQSPDHGGWWGLWVSGTTSYRPGASINPCSAHFNLCNTLYFRYNFSLLFMSNEKSLKFLFIFFSRFVEFQSSTSVLLYN